ncbi:hypothetical protein [Alistipes sp.]|uniref:hypothetical protein n=1 Tax=Alistipes sp. TaxID=1872444 RepID=UPI003076D782
MSIVFIVCCIGFTPWSPKAMPQRHKQAMVFSPDHSAAKITNSLQFSQFQALKASPRPGEGPADHPAAVPLPFFMVLLRTQPKRAGSHCLEAPLTARTKKTRHPAEGAANRLSHVVND